VTNKTLGFQIIEYQCDTPFLRKETQKDERITTEKDIRTSSGKFKNEHGGR
jgi:hypothetical protein